MRERNKSKINNLEGENRKLEKELRIAHRELARLRKQLEHIPPSAFSNFDPDSEAPKKKKEPVCEKCFQEGLHNINITVKGEAFSYAICLNPKCKHRKKTKLS